MDRAEAKLGACREQIERVKQKLRDAMTNLCARERGDGSIDIDFGALAERLSVEHALELRAAIDARHRISGAPGAKPRIVVSASA